MMKYSHLFVFTLILVVTAGCSRTFDYRISDSVFIEDVENPGLPIYSEKGYNSFGVYWGLTPWKTGSGHDPSKIVVNDDSCHIHLSGSIDGEIPYTLVFSLSGYAPDSFTDLLSLNGKSFNLPATECAVSLLLGNSRRDLKIMEGEFKIKRVQNLYVDKELQGTILSGIFSFKATVDDEATTFSNGRFDMRFGEDNFYYLS
ncbi:MAG: hypothetical protein A2W86_08840 [Bacteroidetes bacterium GWD2_45_23]|nr:MAG: hypothetical protein A2W87_09615 [Bacteroidetes bacterium GWC2_46_850]OFX76850.1 MAG: hypothetical protein A2071_02865 [Bacteroidetes bacterium GWC1_47_7]OFX87106.1 MAG: hypothetical protein A2W86_08840 [Bacteroidetes bacterium GWD2_45_23]HAR38369.1 hypothetical protein [Porphyromonadaceae bacterium]HBB01808.1 hypothetical protein [Porphyromonadaceae bacterium]